MVRQERAERTQRRIISAAAEQFEQKGYNGTSLDDITRAAGVSKGAFYFHFASKRQIADAITEHSYGLLEDLVDVSGPGDAHGGPSRCPVPALQQLIDLTHRFDRLLHDEPTVRTALRFHRECPGRTRDFDHYAMWHRCVETLLGRAAKQRELQNSAPEATGWVLATVTLLSVESLVGRQLSDEVTERRVTELWNVLLPAFAARGLTASLRTCAPEPCEVW